MAPKNDPISKKRMCNCRADAGECIHDLGAIGSGPGFGDLVIEHAATFQRQVRGPKQETA